MRSIKVALMRRPLRVPERFREARKPAGGLLSREQRPALNATLRAPRLPAAHVFDCQAFVLKFKAFARRIVHHVQQVHDGLDIGVGIGACVKLQRKTGCAFRCSPT